MMFRTQMFHLILFVIGSIIALPTDRPDVDGESSRKVIGSSVVTSVSVIMDTGNGSKAVYTDAAGKPMAKPAVGSDLASPIDLLNPDRYEFYTFNDNGDLIKRLMTWDEIRGIIASGDGDGFSSEAFTSQGYMPEKRVDDVVSNVQNVLKEEIESHKESMVDHSGLFDTPDVSHTWSMILPAIFGNSGETIKPEKPIMHGTPDTVMIEPSSQTTTSSNSVSLTKDQNPSSSTETDLDSQLMASSPYVQIATSNPSIKQETKGAIVTQSIPENSVTITSPSSSSNKLVSQTSQYIEIYNTSHFTSSTTTTTTQLFTSNTTPETENTRSTTIKPPISLNLPISSSTFRSILSSPIPELFSTVSPLSSTKKIDEATQTTEPSTQISTISTTSQVRPTINQTTNSSPVVSKPTALPVYSTVKNYPLTTTEGSTVPIGSTETSIRTTTTETYSTDSWTTTDASTYSPTSISEATTMKSSELAETKYSESKTEFHTESTSNPWDTSEGTSTYSPLVTFFSVDGGKVTSKSEFTTLDNNIESSIAMTMFKTEANRDDTAIESPETNMTYMSEETTPSTGISTNKSDVATTEFATGETTDILTKMSATEILEQLLLSPDNIYIINSELSEKPPLNLKHAETVETFTYSELESRTTQETIGSTTTGMPKLSAINFENAETQTTTYPVTTEGLVTETTNNQSISTDHAQTEGTNTPNISIDSSTSTDKMTTEVSLLDENAVISNSVGSILSQVFGYDHLNLSKSSLQASASIEEYTTTRDEFTSLPDRQFQDQTYLSTAFDVTTVNTVNSESSSVEATTVSNGDLMAKTTPENSLTDTTTYSQWETPTTTMRYQKVETTDLAALVEEESEPTSTLRDTTMQVDASADDYKPHIINITIISNTNMSKPAKSDTSLEVEYDYEIYKNMYSANNSNNELLETEESSTLQEDHLKNITKNYESSIKLTTTHNYDLMPSINTNRIKYTEFNKASFNSSKRYDDVNPDFPMYVSTESTVDLNKSSEHSIAQDNNNKQSTVDSQNPIIALKISENVFNKDASENAGNPSESSWTPVSTIPPQSQAEHPDKFNYKPKLPFSEQSQKIDLVPEPLQGFGLEESITKLDNDIYQFVHLCNELAFGFWKSATNGVSQARSLIISPFAATSLLAMVFLGARGSTSGEMNEILKLDDMVTFNPHLIFKNVSESIEAGRDSGVAVSAIVRQLYSDRSRGKLLDFYKERARQFYDGHVEEVSFREIGDIIRRRTNLLIKKESDGKVTDFLKDNSITAKAPLAAISASVFQTDCSQASSIGRDGELHFVVLPTIRQRRLIPIPAVVYRSNFLAGYEASLDATAVALGSKDQSVSTIFILPGQQGITALGDGLSRLEKRLIESSFRKGAWSRLLRSLIPRPGLEVQLPRFSHRSIINATIALKRLGLKDLFNPSKADLRGLNGIAHELHLSDMLQINNFATCGEDRIAESHHSEIYPATALTTRRTRLLGIYENEFMPNYRRIDWDEPRDYQRSFHDPLHNPRYLLLPLNLRPRQARLPEAPRLRFDRPFLFVVRHNPTGLILHMGRFNPRLLP